MREINAPAQTFGEFIQSKREARNMSQSDVAQRANTKQGTISKIENGLREPTLNMALRICDALGVDINEYVHG